MSNLEIAKSIVKASYSIADCGLFFCRSITGDEMTNLYDENGLTIDLCYHYSYLEVFGLNEEERAELKNYYDSLGGRNW